MIKSDFSIYKVSIEEKKNLMFSSDSKEKK
jgi:hypothetical protein